MPLTTLQKEVLAVLAANRSPESHFAGGIVLNASDESARFSHDFDLFHELAEEVSRSSTRDVDSLGRAGFNIEKVSRAGEWTHESTFRKARIVRGTESVEIDWAADSAFRFFPIEQDLQLGWRRRRPDHGDHLALVLRRCMLRRCLVLHAHCSAARSLPSLWEDLERSGPGIPCLQQVPFGHSTRAKR